MKGVFKDCIVIDSYKAIGRGEASVPSTLARLPNRFHSEALARNKEVRMLRPYILMWLFVPIPNHHSQKAHCLDGALEAEAVKGVGLFLAKSQCLLNKAMPLWRQGL
jgi:hypothetical protein